MLPTFKVRFYQKHVDEVLQGHKPTLTHSDGQGKNIILTKDLERSVDQQRALKVSLMD